MPTPWHGICSPLPPLGGGGGYPLGIPHCTVRPCAVSSKKCRKNFYFQTVFLLTSVTLVKRKLHAHAEKYLKKYLKNACAIRGLCYSLGMENAFATISAESDLRDMITLTPQEIEEANAWYDSLPDMDIIAGE